MPTTEGALTRSPIHSVTLKHIHKPMYLYLGDKCFAKGRMNLHFIAKH